MKLPNIKLFSQNDSRWKSKKLGTSAVSTIGGYGCLLCDITTMANYHGKETTPDKMNDDLVRIDGFYQGSLLVYGKVSEVYSDIQFDWQVWEEGECADKPAPLDLIDKILASARIPIVKVDYHPETSKLDEHWVCIIGKDEAGSYIIADPIDGSEQYFQARYGDPARYIFRIVAYSGPVKEVETTEALKAEIAGLHLQLSDAHKALASLQTTVSELQAEIKGYKEDAENLREENRNLVIADEKQKIEIKKLTEQYHESEVEKTTALESLTSSRRLIIKGTPLLEILKIKFLKGGEDK